LYPNAHLPSTFQKEPENAFDGKLSLADFSRFCKPTQKIDERLWRELREHIYYTVIFRNVLI
jgi:hypothetical protein